MAITLPTDSLNPLLVTGQDSLSTPELVEKERRNAFESAVIGPERVREEAYQERLATWKVERGRKLDSAALDFENFMPGKRDAVKQRILVKKAIEMETGKEPDDIDLHRMARAQVGKRLFGKDAKIDSDEAFLSAYQSKAQDRKARRDFVSDLVEKAKLSALSGGGQVQMNFSEMAKSNPVYQKNPAEFIKLWKNTRQEILDEFADVSAQLFKINQSIQRDETGAIVGVLDGGLLGRLSDEEFDKISRALAFIQRSQVESGADRGVVGNLGESTQRDGESTGRKIKEGILDLMSGLSSSTTGPDYVADDVKFRDKVNGRLAEIRRLRDMRDPIKLISSEDSKMASFEKALYATPGVGMTVAGSIVTGSIGTLGLLNEAAYEDYYLEAIDAGVDRAEARSIAGSVAPVVGALQLIPERLGLRGVTGKLPFLDKALAKLPKAMTGKAGRIAGGTIAGGVAETATEEVQAIIQEMGRDSLEWFNENIPGADWDAHWENFGERNLVTFLSIAPYTALGAYASDRGMDKAIERAREATANQLVASGKSPESVGKFQKAETPQERRSAFAEMMASEDPDSPSTKEAAKKEADIMRRKSETAESVRKFGISPAVRFDPNAEGVEVYDTKTGETIAQVNTHAEATEIVLDTLEMKAAERSSTLAELAPKLEAAAIDSEQSGEAVDVELRTFTESDMMNEIPDAEARYGAELELLEQRDGGTGEITKEVMGERGRPIMGAFIPSGQMGRREAVTKLWNGSSVLTLIHERAHDKRRKLMKSGAWSRGQQVGAIKALDSFLSQSEKAKTFLPANFDQMDAAKQEVALDEAVAELAEVLALNTRKGEKNKLGSLISKNLREMTKNRIPGAAQLGAFIRAMKEFFGIQLRRAAVLRSATRSGKLNQGQIDKLTDLLIGKTEQESFEQERDSVPTQMVDGEPVDVPFSISPAQDAAYLSAVESGDMEAAQGMVDEAAKAAGYDVKGYHGTVAQFDRFKIDDWRKWQAHRPELTGSNKFAAMFATTREEAKKYGDRVLSLWLKTGKSKYEKQVVVQGAPYNFRAGNTVPLLRKGYDSIFYGSKDINKAREIAIFNPNQIKSADPVTYDSEGNVIPLSQRFDETRDEISFQIGDSKMLDNLVESASRRVRKPEAKAKIFGDLARRLQEIKRDVTRIKRAFGKDYEQDAIVDPRTMASLRKERNFRQAIREEELEDEILQREGRALAVGDAMKLKDMPIHGFIARPGKGMKGGEMESPSAFRKRTGRDPGAEYEGSEGMLGSMLYGGNRSPDQMAQELFEQGLISQNEPSLMWERLREERTQVKEMKEQFDAALKAVRSAKPQAKAEADAWLEKAIEEQKRDNGQEAQMRRALVMYDAILKALPPELRGKMGGFVALSKLRTNEKRLEFLERKIEKADEVVEKWIRKEQRKLIDKLFDSAKPKKTGKGVPKAKLSADQTDQILAIKDLSVMSRKEYDDKITKIEKALQEETDQDVINTLTNDLIRVMTFGNIDGKNAIQLEEFFSNLSSIYTTGKMLKEFQDEKFRNQANAMKQIVNKDVTGGGGRLTSSEAKRMEKERGKFKSLLQSFHRHNISFEWLINSMSRRNKDVGTLESDTHKAFSVEVHKATHREKRDNMAMQERYRNFLSSVFGTTKKGEFIKRVSDFSEEKEGTGVIKTDYFGEGAFSVKKVRAANVQAILDGSTTLKALGLNQEEFKSAKARYYEILKDAKNKEEARALREGRPEEPVSIHGNRVVEFESPNVGKPDNLTLSQGQAINLLMLYRQKDLKESMKREGYSEATMEQMEGFLTPESRQIMDWLTEEYEANYETINEVFKRNNGVSLPKTEFYSPARRLHEGTVQDMQIDSAGNTAMSTAPSFLISRVKNFAEVDQTADALSLYMQHMAQTNHYVNWADTVKMLRTVFGDKTVKKNITDYAGSSLLSLISERIQWFADGGNRKASHYRSLDALRAAHTYSSLSYNWTVAIKQLTSLPAYAFDMGFADFGKYAAKFMKNPVKNLMDMMKEDYVQARFNEGYERDVIEGLRREGGRFTRALKAGMIFGKAGDIVPVMIGGWMSRQRSYDQAIADGMTEKRAREKSIIDFEMATDRAQQAGDLKDLSSLQGGGSLARVFTMYKTSPRQYYANVYESFLDAKAGKKGAKKEFARRFLIGQVILPLTFQFVSDLLKSPFDDEDDFALEDYLRAVLLGPLNGLFMAGDWLEIAFSGIADAQVYLDQFVLSDGASKVAFGFKDFWDGDLGEGIDDVARGVGKVAPGPVTFYDIIRKELKRFDALD